VGRTTLSRLWVLVLALALGPSAALGARPTKGKDAGAPDAAFLHDASQAGLAEAASAGDATTDAAPDSIADDGTAEPSPDAPGAAPAAAPPGSVAPAPSSAPSGAPSATPSAAPSGEATAEAVVHIRDRKAFSVRVARGGQSAAQRAASASQALERAVNDTDAREVRVAVNGDVAVLFLGESPIIQLGPDDATADGDASLGVHAAAVQAKLQTAVTAERNRKAYSQTALAISALVCSALVVFFLLGKVGGLENRMRAWIEAHPERLPNIRVAGIDVIRPAALRGGIVVAIDAMKWVLRLGAAYAWLLFALSLFDATRAYSERLTGFVFAPLSALMGRLASALPVLLVGAIAGLAVVLLVRFVALFFGSVARGETSLAWLPGDLAAPTSILVRAGIVLVALTLAAPLVTGTEEGVLGRASAIALIALGLSATPLLASVAVGIAVLFGRRLTVGEFAEVGGKAGLVRALSLLEVSLEDAHGCEVRVPHFASLLHPTRLLGKRRPVEVDLVVATGAEPAKVKATLEKIASGIGERSRVTFDWIDAEGAGYTVVAFSADADAKTALLTAITAALAAEGVGLGKRRARREGAS
jgi:small-conductance mechanosensitive channel